MRAHHIDPVEGGAERLFLPHASQAKSDADPQIYPGVDPARCRHPWVIGSAKGILLEMRAPSRGDEEVADIVGNILVLQMPEGFEHQFRAAAAIVSNG